MSLAALSQAPGSAIGTVERIVSAMPQPKRPGTTAKQAPKAEGGAATDKPKTAGGLPVVPEKKIP